MIYLDGHICATECKPGQVANTTDSTLYKCENCRVDQCKVCELDNLEVCLECFDNFLVHEGKCVSECPSGYRQGENAKACRLWTVNDMDLIYFPFLLVALILSLIVIFGKCKKKAGRTMYINT